MGLVKLKMQVQKPYKKGSSSLIQTVGGEESVLVTLSAEAHSREACEAIFSAIADFTEKLNPGAGNSQ